MRKQLLVLALLLVPGSLFAQPHQYLDNFFELSPFVGYRYGGTIYASDTNLFRQDADIQSNANFGLLFGIPLNNGWKIEMAVDRQDSHFTSGNGLFAPENNMGNVDTTYYYAGMMMPFAATRSAVPYFTFGGGVGHIDPHINNASSETAFMETNRRRAKQVAYNTANGVQALQRNTTGGANTATGVEALYHNTGGNNNYHNGCNCSYNYGSTLDQGETNFGMYFRF